MLSTCENVSLDLYIELMIFIFVFFCFYIKIDYV